MLLPLCVDRKILNYGELDDRVNRLAFYLAECGVKPGVIAGVSLDRSPELVISVLAIMKAGGAYLPLDTSYPSSRLAFMAADAQITVLITQQRLLGLWGKCECGVLVGTNPAYRGARASDSAC